MQMGMRHLLTRFAVSFLQSFGDGIAVRNPLRVQNVLPERTDIAESLGSSDVVRETDESESEILLLRHPYDSSLKEYRAMRRTSREN